MSTALEELELHLQEALGMSVIGLNSTIRALTIAVVAPWARAVAGPPGPWQDAAFQGAGGRLGR